MSTKVALILGTAIVIAVAIWIYFSPYETCVRAQMTHVNTFTGDRTSWATATTLCAQAFVRQ